MGYSYKQEKIIVIMYEYINDKREFFPVSNIPLEKAKFFYKDNEGLFKLMAVSDYVVRTELNEARLYITNENIKENSKKFQIGYEINFKALEYESPLPVLSILVEMYNQLVEDSKTLFNYVKKQCFISDDKSTSLILPSLPNACVWCMGEDGNIFALPVSELYENFNKMVDKVYEDVKKLLLTDLRENTDLLLSELRTLKNKLAIELEEYKDNLKKEINLHTKDKKVEIDDYIALTSKPDINEFVDDEKVNFTRFGEEHKESLKGEKGDTGERGEIGPIGPKGEQGIQGIQGVQGEQGKQGIQGIQGERGIKGDKGDKGDAGNDAVIVETKGMYGFQVKNGHLYLLTTRDETPDLKIKDGHLILTL